MNRETRVTVEEPEEEPIPGNIYISERVTSEPPSLTLPWWQRRDDSESDMFTFSSPSSRSSRQFAPQHFMFGSMNSAFDRMNQLFDGNSHPDIKVFSTSTWRRIDREGNVEEQVAVTSRYKEASKVVGYTRRNVSEEEAVFCYRQLGQRGREARHVREHNVYKVYDNYLNCTPEDEEAFESDWQRQDVDGETHYSIPVHFLDEAE